jgi:hypothetical protein
MARPKRRCARASSREAEYRQAIPGYLELWGVDKVDGSMASIVGEIRCTDSGRQCSANPTVA